MRLIALIVLVMVHCFAQAQSPGTSETIGILVLRAPAATNSSVPSNTSMCFPLYQTPLGADVIGRISDVTFDTISNSEAGWTSNAFSQSGAPHFARILTGAAKGRTLAILANTGTQLTVNNQSTDLTTLGIATGMNGDRYEIFAGDTLLSRFGTAALGGPNADVADNVVIWNGAAWETYFYDNVDNRWERKGLNLSANNVILRPDVATIFVRRSTSPFDLTLIGRPPTDDLRYIVSNSGSTYLGNGFPVAITLVAHAFNTLPGWVSMPQTQSSLADKINVWTGVSWQRYFYDSVDERWEMVGLNFNANNVVFPIGRPIMFEKATGAPGYSIFLHSIPYSP